MVDDPTTTGKITHRTAHILSQVRRQFPTAAWSCFSPRPGQPSEHSLGRACDGTFGNSIGVAAQGPALDLGWKVTNWMKANADTLGVQYLIWQGKIWSVARSARSDEHTSELQSLMRTSYAVFCLKKNTQHIPTHTT